jgi:hypothetical protein
MQHNVVEESLCSSNQPPPITQYTAYTYDLIYLLFAICFARCSSQRQMSMSNFKTFPRMGCSPQQRPWSPWSTPTMSRITIPPENFSNSGNVRQDGQGTVDCQIPFCFITGEGSGEGYVLWWDGMPSCWGCKRGGMDTWEEEPEMNRVDFCACSSPLLPSTRWEMSWWKPWCACGVEWWFRHVLAIADGGVIQLLHREGETTTISTSSYTSHKWQEGNLAW